MVVRVIVFLFGVLLLVGSGVGMAYGAPLPAIVPAVFGLILVIGTVFERVYYKATMSKAPGKGFVRTQERFVDPATARMVEVHVNPGTGERAYVDVGPAPPHQHP